MDDKENLSVKLASRLSFFTWSRQVGVVTSVAVLGLAAWWLARVPPPPIEESIPFASTSVVKFDETEMASSSTVPPLISVHVAGAVQNPGLYRFRIGARINEAVLVAGGPTSLADLNAVNLATLLVDGQQIFVPRRGEKTHIVVHQSVPNTTITPGNRVVNGDLNINSATESELEQLPGIGPAIARSIIQYRESNGGFGAIEDLLKVKGVGQAKLELISGLIRTN